MGWWGRLFSRGGREARHEARASPMHPRESGWAEWLGGPNTVPGIHVTPALALRCPAVYAPIRLLSGTLSILPLQLFRRGADGARTPADDSPLYDLLHAKPNDWQTSAQFRRVMTERMLGWGNGYARIRNPGLPTAVEPLASPRVLPYRGSDNRVWYRYTPAKGPVETLHPDEVLHLRYGPAKDDEGLESESPLILNRETVALGMAATEYLARFFANYAVPKGALEVPTKLDRVAGQLMRDSWEERHSGLANAHRIAILDGGIKFSPIGHTNADSQFLELYKAICGEIAAKVYGIPPHLVGDTEKQTSFGAGVEQMGIGYVTHTLLPITEEWEQSLDASILTASGRRTLFWEMNVDGLMRGDFKSRMEGYALMIQWGLATPNEVRRLMNLPAIAGGDSRLQALNMAPAERIMEVLLKPSGAAEKALREILGGRDDPPPFCEKTGPTTQIRRGTRKGNLPATEPGGDA